ncbi:MAG: ATPase domain-containing protein, partial [Pseudolabrys sp.]
MRIPGISELTDGEESLLPTLFLLEGPLGVGKRDYCTKFLEEGINDNAYCIIVSARLTDSQFIDLFYKIDQKLLKDKFKFINPLLTGSGYEDVSLNSVHKEIFSFLQLDNKKRKQIQKQDKDPAVAEKQVCLVIESLNQLCDIFDVEAVRKFLSKLTIIVKKIGATAIYTIDTPVIDKYIPLTSFCEGKLEMKFEESEGGPLSRKIRLLSSSHVISSPRWINFAIDDKGMVTFGDNLVACTMDSKPIQGTPIYHNDMPFCSENCIKTFKKLSPLFAPINPKPVVLDYHFFFIDIVGLSDP